MPYTQLQLARRYSLELNTLNTASTVAFKDFFYMDFFRTGMINICLVFLSSFYPKISSNI